jgi:predicted transcriptional regulator
MTSKEKILNVISSLDDNVSIEQAIDRLYLLHKIEIGLQQADAGEGMEHDQFMKQLEDEITKNYLDATIPRGLA